MPNKAKQKGDRVERRIVDLHGLMGISGQRIPLSGAAGDRFSGDVILEVPGVGNFKGEVKARQNAGGFKMIIRWLADNKALFLVEDRKPPLVVLSWDAYRDVMGALVDAYGSNVSEATDEEAE